MIPLSVQHIMRYYNPLLSLPPEECENIGRTHAIPKFDESVLVDLCHSSIEILKTQKPLLELNAPIYVIGDLHGNIFDLLRIFIISNPPPMSRFLFLGDYVDRGQFSIEVVTLLLSLQVIYPEHIYLIRGNHEFECVNSFYGFKDECTKHYSSKNLYDEFNLVFSYLPLAAIINNDIFCVHGGLSPQLTSLDQFNKLQMPMKTYDPEFVADIVWSDPSSDSDAYVRSNRGTGVTFGKTAIADFLEDFNFTTIIRAHQCVEKGIQFAHKKQVITVFSASYYTPAGNSSGFIVSTIFIHKVMMLIIEYLFHFELTGY